MGLTNPASPLLMGLKIVAGGAFLILGILFMIDKNRFYEGLVLVAISSAWVYFVIRNYKRQGVDLASLR